MTWTQAASDLSFNHVSITYSAFKLKTVFHLYSIPNENFTVLPWKHSIQPISERVALSLLES